MAKTRVEIAEEIKKKGIDAAVENGILYLRGVDHNQAVSVLADVGYNSTWGIKHNSKEKSSFVPEVGDVYSAAVAV